MTDGPSLMPFIIIAVGFPAVWCAWIYEKKEVGIEWCRSVEK